MPIVTLLLMLAFKISRKLLGVWEYDRQYVNKETETALSPVTSVLSVMIWPLLELKSPLLKE